MRELRPRLDQKCNGLLVEYQKAVNARPPNLKLGTQTLKATVDEAFDEVLALEQRRRALLAERSVDESLLSDPDARRAAWG